MKTIYRIIGVSALILTLVCNLEYSFFFKVKNSPSAAKAAWTSIDMYGTTIFCGSEPQNVWKAGTWFQVLPTDWNYNSYVSSTYPYNNGYYYFVQSNDGTECGLNQPSSDTNFRQDYTYEITAPTPPTFAY
jgi:hypothetical protein